MLHAYPAHQIYEAQCIIFFYFLIEKVKILLRGSDHTYHFSELWQESYGDGCFRFSFFCKGTFVETAQQSSDPQRKVRQKCGFMFPDFFEKKIGEVTSPYITNIVNPKP